MRGDNAEEVSGSKGSTRYEAGDMAFDRLWTLYAGLRFNFNENIALKGTFYHQDYKIEQVDRRDTAPRYYWRAYDENPNHWSIILDVRQPALKYTSAWLEYGQYDRGFVTRSTSSIFASPTLGMAFSPDDMKYWRVALGQEWNDKWATYLFYYGYKFDHLDEKPAEYGVGVRYALNDYTSMGLNYMHVNGDDYVDDDNLVRFRTSVSF